MQRLLVFVLIALTSSPVLAEETWEKSYQIITEGKTLQSGVYARNSNCRSTSDNVCKRYVAGYSGLVSLILHNRVMYKCFVGSDPIIKPNMWDEVSGWQPSVTCREVPKTKPNN